MARIKGSLAAEVQLEGLASALKCMAKTVGRGKGLEAAVSGAALVEVDAVGQRLTISTTDLEAGACACLPCSTGSSWRALMKLAPALARAVGKHADAVDGQVRVELSAHAVTFGGVHAEDLGPDCWPEAWTWEGLWKPSRSDVLEARNLAELVGALEVVRPFARPGEQDLVGCVHLRRGPLFGRWRAEATDGHRAMAVTGSGALVRDLLIPPRAVDAISTLWPLADEQMGMRLMTYNEDVCAGKAGGVFALMRGKHGGVLVVAAKPAHEMIWKTDGTVDFPPLDTVTPEKKTCAYFTGEAGLLRDAAKAVIDLSGARAPRSGPFPHEHAARMVVDAMDREVRVCHNPSGRRFLAAGDSAFLDSEGRVVDDPGRVEVVFDPRYLLDLAAAFGPKATCEYWLARDGTEPLLVEGGNCRHLLMPMRP